MALCIRLSNFEKMSFWFKNLIFILNEPCKSIDFNKSFKNLIKLCRDNDGLTHHFLQQPVEQEYDIRVYKTIYKSSPFFHHFNKILIISQQTTSEQINDTNPYYNPLLLNLMLTKYLPYYPLWSGLILKRKHNIETTSNAPVEQFFGNLKRQILNNEKKLKRSRFISKLRENVLSVYIQQNFDIKKSRLTKQIPEDICSEQRAKEIWVKKEKPKNSYFLGLYLKKLNLEKEEQISMDSEKCLYCGFGRLDVTTDWVQCDECNKWVHETCENDNSFENSFYCKLCIEIVKYSESGVRCDNLVKSPKLVHSLKKTLEISPNGLLFILIIHCQLIKLDIQFVNSGIYFIAL